MALTSQENEEFKKLYGFDPSGSSTFSTTKVNPTVSPTIPSPSKSSFSDQEKKQFRDLYGFDPGGSKPKAPTPTTAPAVKPIAQQQPQEMNNPNTQAILQTLLGAVPGGQQLQRGFNPTTTSQQRIQDIQHVSNPFNLIGDLAKGIAGAPIRFGLSIADLFGGSNGAPKTLNVPILGPQQSYQTGERQMIQQGVNPGLAGGISAVGAILDTLGLKGMGSMFKRTPPVEAPVVPPPEVPQAPRIPSAPGAFGADFIRQQQQGITPNNLSLDLLRSIRNDSNIIPKPDPIIPPDTIPTNSELAMRNLAKSREKPTTPPPETIPTDKPVSNDILNKLVRAPDNPNIIQRFMTRMSKYNPYQFETEHIKNMGDAGKQLATLGTRANSSAIVTSGEIGKIIQTTGVDKLPIDQQLNLRDVLENKAQPMNPQIQQLASTWRQVFDKYGAETQSQIIQNYFPRSLNKAGVAFYRKPENSASLIDSIVQEQGVTRTQALKIINQGLRKGAFEHSRVLDNVPNEYRANPIDEIYNWATDVSRRKGVIENFGKNNQNLDPLLAEINKTHGIKGEIQAQDYIKRVQGKDFQFSNLDPIYKALRSNMVISKINPITALGNETQGFTNSYMQYGTKGIIDAVLSKDGKQLVDQLGMKELNGKFGEDISPESWATKWMDSIFSGKMKSSELRGMVRTASSTDQAITRAFDTLKKNPMDIAAKKLLNDHAMYVDDQTLASDLAKGKISDFERKIGIVEGTRQKMFFTTPGERPVWANSPPGSVAYTFHSYLLNQLKLVHKAPLHRQLAYYMAIAPLTGLPVLLLRRAVQGKPLPKDALDWYLSSAAAGPGTALDILNSLSINPVGYAAGGFSPVVDMGLSKNKAKSAVSNLPLQSFYLNRLFPPKK